MVDIWWQTIETSVLWLHVHHRSRASSAGCLRNPSKTEMFQRREKVDSESFAFRPRVHACFSSRFWIERWVVVVSSSTINNYYTLPWDIVSGKLGLGRIRLDIFGALAQHVWVGSDRSTRLCECVRRLGTTWNVPPYSDVQEKKKNAGPVPGLRRAGIPS